MSTFTECTTGRWVRYQRLVAADESRPTAQKAAVIGWSTSDEGDTVPVVEAPLLHNGRPIPGRYHLLSLDDGWYRWELIDGTP